MKYITLYRKHFKTNPDGTSFFEDYLSDLRFKKERWNDIDEVEIRVDDVLDVFDNKGNATI